MDLGHLLGVATQGAPTSAGRLIQAQLSAVRGHICEDSEQELASVAWLKGGGDDNIAALRLVRA